MERNIEDHLANYNINTVNRNITDASENYIVKILIKLRKRLRFGPLNNSAEPYTGPLGISGGVLPFCGNKFHAQSTPVEYIPVNTLSYVTAPIFFLPEYINEMVDVYKLPSNNKTKLQMIYEKCVEAVQNNSKLRAPNTHIFYQELCKFIEIALKPDNRVAFTKLTDSSPDFIDDEFLEYFRRRLYNGATLDSNIPYELGTFGGITIEKPDGQFVNVPTHISWLISDLKDNLRNCQYKSQRFFFTLINAIVSNSETRHFTTQQFYVSLLEDFTQKINTRPIPQAQKSLRLQ